MSRRQWALVITVVVLASALSSAIAYRYGARGDSQRAAVASAAGSAAAASAAIGPCVSFTQAAPLVGNSSCITGRVLKVFTSKAGNTYFDFCEDYRKCPFSTVIFSEDRAKFGDLAYLQGQVIEIRGLVSFYRERPQIIIRDPDQVKLRD